MRERDFERAKFRKRDERLGQHLGASPRVRFDVVHVEHRRVVVVVVVVSSVVFVAGCEFVRGSSPPPALGSPRSRTTLAPNEDPPTPSTSSRGAPAATARTSSAAEH